MSVSGGLDRPTFYTPQDIADRWKVTAETVRFHIRSGALEGFRIGPKLLRVRADKLAEYEARKVADAARPKGREAMTPEEHEVARRNSEAIKIAFLAVSIARGRRRTRRGG